MSIRKLCIAIPNLGYIKTHTVSSVYGASIATMGEYGCPIDFFLPCYSNLAEDRNLAVNEALSTHASHLMFIDSDVSFPDDGIIRLARHEKPIVGGVYNMKDGTGSALVAVSGDKIKHVYGSEIPKEPFQVKGVATGFLLIDMEVFKRVPWPWFFFSYKAHGVDYVGEDYNFCIKAQKFGFEVWCDPTIPIKHIGDYEY